MNPLANGQPAVKRIQLYLPETAEDVYYRDDIGNISTSHLNRDDDYLRLDLVPRFPLFGGWSTSFNMGYNLPSGAVLGTDYNSGKFILNSNILPTITDDVFFSSLRVKVILPEGANGVEYDTPFPVEVTQGVEVTYLDYSGRPTVNFKANNLVLEHNDRFNVKYYFSSSSLIGKLITVICAIFAVLFVVMALSRVELNITDDTREKENNFAVSKLETLFDERDEIFQIFDDAINEYVASEEKENYDEAMRTTEEKLNAVNHNLAEASAGLSKGVHKIEEIIGQTLIMINSIKENHKLTIDYKILKKIQKSNYTTQHKKAQSKFESARDRSDILITAIIESSN